MEAFPFDFRFNYPLQVSVHHTSLSERVYSTQRMNRIVEIVTELINMQDSAIVIGGVYPHNYLSNILQEQELVDDWLSFVVAHSMRFCRVLESHQYFII
jgi:hypothetical protein